MDNRIKPNITPNGSTELISVFITNCMNASAVSNRRIPAQRHEIKCQVKSCCIRKQKHDVVRLAKLSRNQNTAKIKRLQKRVDSNLCKAESL